MGSIKEDEDFFEEDIVFDQQRLLISRTAKKKSAIHRVSSGKCITFAKTLGLCGTFFGLGLCVAVPDYTFSTPIVDVDIQQKGASSPLLTNLFTARSFGYIVGSLIAGFLFDRYNRLFLLFLSLLFTCIFISLTPWCHTVWLLESNMLVLGISVGFLSTGGNVLCLDLWGRNSGPFMQALHFSFALGILVAPLLTSPISEQTEVQKLSSSDVNSNNDDDYNNVLSSSSRPSTIIDNLIKRDLNSEFINKSLNKTDLLDDYGYTKSKVLKSNTASIGSINISVVKNMDAKDRIPDAVEVPDNSKNKYTGTTETAVQSESLLVTDITTNVYEVVTGNGFPKPLNNKGHKSDSQNTFINESNKNEKCKSSNNSSPNDKNYNSGLDPLKEKEALSDEHVDTKQSISNSNNFDVNTVSEISPATVPSTKATGVASLQDLYTRLNNENNTVITSVLVFPSNRYTPPIRRKKPGTYDNDTEHLNTLFGLVARKVEKYGFNKLQFTYLIVGSVIFLLSLLFFAFLCNNPRDPKSKQDEFRAKSKKISNICVQIFLVPLTAWFLFLCVGLQSMMSQLISLYAAKSPVGATLSTTPSLPVIFSASFTAMRFASIFFASGFSPSTLLNINMVMFSIGTFVLSSLAMRFEEAVWAGCSLIGIGLASMVPTTILWIERYIHVSNKITMVFVVSSTLGEMLLPNTVYRFMISDPAMFLYATISINLLSVLTLTMLWLLMGKHGQRFCSTSHDGYHLANQHDEEDMLDMASIIQPSGGQRNSNGLLLTNGHFASLP